jgi:hypothetical protein
MSKTLPTWENHRKQLEELIIDTNPSEQDNVIVNRESLEQLLSCKTNCKNCRGNLNVNQTQIGLSSSVNLHCPPCNTNYEPSSQNIFQYMKSNEPPIHPKARISSRDKIKTNVRPRYIEKQFGRDKTQKKVSIHMSTAGMIHWDELTVNTALGVLATGLSSKDVEELFVHMNIQTSKNFKRQWTSLHNFIGKIISKMSADVIEDNLFAEIEATLRDDMKGESEETIKKEIEKWIINDPTKRKVSIAISYDMGWQKRSSGK